MAQKALELAIKIAGKVDPSLGKAMAEAQRETNGLTKTLSTAAKATAAATAAAGAAAIAGITASTQKAITFQSSMADVAKVVDGAKDDNGQLTETYYNLKDGLVQLSKQIPIGVNDLAQIAAAAGQSGIAAKDIVQFTETAGKMQIAFDTSAEQAGEWMATWRAAFSMSQKDVTELADQINYLSNNSNATAPAIADVVTRIGSLGRLAGFSVAEVAAIGDAMVATGAETEVAATAIKKMATVMMLGSGATKKQQAVLKQLGMDSVTLAKNMRVNAKDAVLDLLDALNQLPKEQMLSAVSQYFGQEASGTIGKLVDNMQPLKEAFDLIADSAKYAGSMEEEFASRSDTAENKIQLAKQSLEAAAISVGEIFLPAVAQLADKFAELVNQYSPQITALVQYLVDNGPQVAAAVGGIAAALAGLTFKTKLDELGAFAALPAKLGKGKGGGITELFNGMVAAAQLGSKNLKGVMGTLAVGGSFGDAINWLKLDPQNSPFVKGLEKITKPVTDYTGRLHAALQGLDMGVLGDLANGIGGGITAALDAVKNTAGGALQKALGAAFKLGGGVANLAKPITAALTGALQSPLAGAVGGLLKGVASNLPALANVFTAALGPLTGLFGGILSGALPVVAAIGGIIAVLGILKDNTDGIRAAIATTFGEGAASLFDGALAAISNVGDTIKAVFSPENLASVQQTITKLFGENAGAAFGALVQMVQNVLPVFDQLMQFANTTMRPIIENIFAFITGTVVPGILNLITTTAPTIGQILASVGSMILSVATIIGQAFNAALPVIEAVIGAIMNIAQVVIPAVLGAASGMAASFSGVFGALQGVLQGLIAFITGAFSANWSQAWEGIKQIFGNAFNALVELCKVPINAVIGIINGAIRGINSLGITIPDWVPFESIAGKTFSINVPEIPMLARGGMTDGVSIAGEAGTEAVISFLPQYHAQNVQTWQQAGTMLGVTPQQAATAAGAELVLYPGMASAFAAAAGANSGTAIDLRSALDAQREPIELKEIPVAGNDATGTPGGQGGTDAGMQFVFAPQITAPGGDAQQIQQAVRDMFPEFKRQMAEYLRQQARTGYKKEA